MITENLQYQQTYNVNNTITIKRFSVILKDEIEISRSMPHTKTLCPGDDYSNEDADTQKMCKALWTKSVVNNYNDLVEILKTQDE